jgi:cytoskeletal protein CcmA (bactofilin family)
MMDCREIEIAETGTFKGQAEFDRADIRGNFEGDLTAREYLVVRATGRITGKVRFGELEIERGGQIIGEVQVFDEGAARRTHGDPYDDTRFRLARRARERRGLGETDAPETN